MTRSGRPLLVRCGVLFVDLLGVREMNMSPHAPAHLVALHNAVSVMHRDFFGEPFRYRSAFFSDTLVLAAPIVRGTDVAVIEGLMRMRCGSRAIFAPRASSSAAVSVSGSRRHKRLWEKYRWLGEYHNAVVHRTLPRRRDLRIDGPAMTWQFSAFE